MVEIQILLELLAILKYTPAQQNLNLKAVNDKNNNNKLILKIYKHENLPSPLNTSTKVTKVAFGCTKKYF